MFVVEGLDEPVQFVWGRSLFEVCKEDRWPFYYFLACRCFGQKTFTGGLFGCLVHGQFDGTQVCYLQTLYITHQ